MIKLKSQFKLCRVVRLNRYSLQVIIAKEYCKTLDIKQGDIVCEVLDNDRLILLRVRVEE